LGTSWPEPRPEAVLGISFFTFQAVAYLADIYKGEIEPAGSLFRFALFKSFFPQLIAGPIVRYQQVADDFAADHASEDLFARGVSRFIIGLAKKVIIADNLAPLVDSIFRFPTDAMSAELAWLGALAFGLQIYFDFSGYSDMAIGLAAMFGIRFPENFRHPYVATSIQDFWRRWHISLSTWFRDYLYIPLGGSRYGPLRTCANLFIVFALCGLWHGASWAFLAWGLFHGAFLALERTPFGSLLARAPAPVQHGYVIVVVLVGWAIFRSPTLDHALGMLSAMAGMHGWVSDAISHVIPINPFTGLVIGAAIIGSLPLGRFAERFRATVAYEAAITATLVVAVAFVASQTHLAFIYFRF
jgi:alginate O-acetyltransferase complex protein AlgI